ncbi:hypothetical protein N7G274_005487 [Stereocaulon virgatum]|uniref:Uncharacterized protein n=1 Tax=Stereocaulon virgatum TaxID=373712 RepID=A0ABR4A9E3_9LECA
MVYYDPEFKAPTVQEHEKASGTYVDPKISSDAALPTGHQTISVTTHGASFWAKTTRIDTQLPDGTKKAYFLKAGLTPSPCINNCYKA